MLKNPVLNYYFSFMDISFFKKLHDEGIIDTPEMTNIELQVRMPESVYWDLRTLLYLGIVLFTSAIGIIIYKNIDSIGHAAMLISIAALDGLCFYYCIKNGNGYSNNKVESPGIWYDYILLLASLLLLIFIGYLQFQYTFFGSSWGLALFIPMIILFIVAYYFDHLGVLSMAITNLAAWAGISITPARILRENNFNNSQTIYAGLATGIVLVAVSFVSTRKKIKPHFAFSYKNFGTHVLFISLIALMVYFDNIYLLSFFLLAIISFLFFKNAIKKNSFYFLVITLLYAYIGLSYAVTESLFKFSSDVGAFYLIIIYFIASGIALIKLFIHYNKILKHNASL